MTGSGRGSDTTASSAPSISVGRHLRRGSRDGDRMSTPGVYPRSRWMQQRMWPLILCLTLAACGGAATPTASPSPAGHTLQGTFTLNNGEAVDRTATDCRGTGGYKDIGSGLDATVKDDAGRIIGKGALVARMDDAARLELFRCSYDFRIEAVPESAFYVVAVGSRGELTFTAAEMDAAGWTVGFRLGD